MKRLFDIILSTIGILLLFPILVIVAVMIRLRMPDGPVFFRQERVGRQGQLFTMIKFRTMTSTHHGSTVSVAGEARITPLGRILRKYKLDELPELWNIWIGDMSFVGPRPDVPGFADCLQGEDRIILSLRPGLTGPASLKYRNEEELLAGIPDPIRYNAEVIYPDKVRINRYYAAHPSFTRDIQMMVCTVLGKHMKYNNEII